MGDAYLRADNTLHGGHRISQGKPPKHRTGYLLHPHRGVALRNSFLLHVQRPELN
jgi:hypothetical protein